MIVRILTEGQYRVPDELRERLNELDVAAHRVAESGDEDAFHRAYAELLDLVRGEGSELADDSLDASEVILPPADVTAEEALRELPADGLIPG